MMLYFHCAVTDHEEVQRMSKRNKVHEKFYRKRKEKCCGKSLTNSEIKKYGGMQNSKKKEWVYFKYKFENFVLFSIFQFIMA